MQENKRFDSIGITRSVSIHYMKANLFMKPCYQDTDIKKKSRVHWNWSGTWCWLIQQKPVVDEAVWELCGCWCFRWGAWVYWGAKQMEHFSAIFHVLVRFWNISHWKNCPKQATVRIWDSAIPGQSYRCMGAFISETNSWRLLYLKYVLVIFNTSATTKSKNLNKTCSLKTYLTSLSGR